MKIKINGSIYCISPISAERAFELYKLFVQNSRMKIGGRRGEQIAFRNFLWLILKNMGYNVYQIAGAFGKDRVTVLAALKSVEAWEQNGTNSFYNIIKAVAVKQYLVPEGYAELVGHNSFYRNINSKLSVFNRYLDEFSKDPTVLNLMFKSACDIVKEIVIGSIEMGAVRRSNANKIIAKYCFIDDDVRETSCQE